MSHHYTAYRGRHVTHTGIHAMPPWTYMVGAITGGVSAIFGILTPAELSQWISLMFSVVYGGIFLYGYWVRTTTAPKPERLPRDESETFMPRNHKPKHE